MFDRKDHDKRLREAAWAWVVMGYVATIFTLPLMILVFMRPDERTAQAIVGVTVSSLIAPWVFGVLALTGDNRGSR